MGKVIPFRRTVPSAPAALNAPLAPGTIIRSGSDYGIVSPTLTYIHFGRPNEGTVWVYSLSYFATTSFPIGTCTLLHRAHEVFAPELSLRMSLLPRLRIHATAFLGPPPHRAVFGIVHDAVADMNAGVWRVILERSDHEDLTEDFLLSSVIFYDHILDSS